MKPLFSSIDFDNAKSKDLLPLKCYQCNNIFYKNKQEIQAIKNPNLKDTGKFCSLKCCGYYQQCFKTFNCTNCETPIVKMLKEIKKSKSGNHFCSQSCAATYNNKHKSFGTTRSKLEVYIEKQLTSLYSDLNIHFNRKDTIGSELDIYIPDLNLAFELNGIFHYEPIYGVNKLQQIQENDISKSKACHDHKIDLCIIDTSHQKYFKESTSKQYLDIIINTINKRTTLTS
jgi:hypothetical protein